MLWRHTMLGAFLAAGCGDDGSVTTTADASTTQPTSSTSTTSSSTDIDESGATSSTSSSEGTVASSTTLADSSSTGAPSCEDGIGSCALPDEVEPWSSLATQAHSGEGARELGVNLLASARAVDGGLAILIVPYSPETPGAQAAVKKLASDGVEEWEVALSPDARAIGLRGDGTILVAGGTELWLMSVDSTGHAGPVTPISGWDAATVGVAATSETFLLGTVEQVPILAMISGDAVSWTLEAPGDLPEQENAPVIAADGESVVIAGRAGPDLVLAAYDTSMVEVWRWEGSGGEFTFPPVVARHANGWMTATSSPPSVHFLDEGGETLGVIPIPEPPTGPGLITTLQPRGEGAWLTVVALAKGVNDQPLTEMYEVRVGDDPCCSLHVFDLWQGYYPSAITSTAAGGALLLGDRCDGITCAVAQTKITQRR